VHPRPPQPDEPDFPGDDPAVPPLTTAAARARDSSNLAFLLASSGLVSLCALVFNIVLTRTLSVEDYGHIGVVRTVLDLLGVPAAFGLGACIARFAADARASDSERSRMLVTAVLLTLATSVATTLLGFGLLQWPRLLPDPVALGALRWLVFLLPFVALFGTLLGFLQGVGRVRPLAVAQAARGVLRLALGWVMVWLWGFTGWIAGRWAADVLSVLSGLPYVLPRLRARPDPRYLRPFLSFSGYATLTLALTTLLTGIDVLSLVHFHADPEIIAHYKVATYIFNTALLLPITFIQARYSNMVAHAYDPHRTWRSLWENTNLLMLLVLPAAVIGYFMAPVLPMIFGEGYTPSIEIFRWLLPAFIIHSAGKVSSNLVVGAGLMRAQLWTSVATLALNAVLNLALIPSMGVAGAVIATTGSLALKSALSPWVLSRYRLGVAPRGES
jgi:O-antigen/teichoic acid export membrane protein